MITILSREFKGYNWDKNYGYGTRAHLDSLLKYGITKHHRKKFKPVHNMLMHTTRETL